MSSISDINDAFLASPPLNSIPSPGMGEIPWIVEPFSPSESDDRFAFDCSDEDVWIPMDQTIHWGKRPNSSYPQVRLLKEKSELPKIPRGRHLVARLLSPEWEFDEAIDNKPSRPEPSLISCLEDEKTVVPFEKGVAIFRHLRASKAIKLKGTESVLIRSLRVEIGHHNAFDAIPFKSLDIILTRNVRVHLVAHKRSVEIMQKHGLLPELPKKDKKEAKHELQSLEPPTKPVQTTNEQPSPTSEEKTGTEIVPARKRSSSALVTMTDSDSLKKQKTNLITDIFDEVSQIQQSIDFLGKRVVEFLNLPTTTTIRVTCNPDVYPPNVFVFYAFRTRDMGLALTMMSKCKDFDINYRDEKGYTLLHTAAKSGFLEGAMWCIFNGANVNAPSNNGTTPLHLAYQRNDKGVKKALKEAGANVDATNVYGMKPKDYTNRRRPLVTHSLCHGGKVEVTMEGLEKPFLLTVWYAARIGWLEVVAMYIENLGTDVDTKNSNGQTPLMCAAEYGRAHVVAYLLKEGADPNARDIHDRTPLHYGYLSGDPAILECLHSAGADPNLNNIWRRSPTFYKEGMLKQINSKHQSK